LFFDIYNAVTLTSALITNNCPTLPNGVLPNGYFSFTDADILPILSAGFNVTFNDTKSITEGSLSFPYKSEGTEVLLPILGLLLCTPLSNDLIFFEGYLPNPDVGQYLFQSIIYNGIYSIVAYDSIILATKNILYNQILIISSVGPATYQFPNGFSINAIANSTILLTVQNYTTNPTGVDPPGKISQGQFVELDTQNATIGLQASLTFTYINYIPNFVIGYYNGTAGAWVFSDIPPTVNTTAKTVTQNTTHFSTWGLYGETATANSLSPLYLFSITLILVLIFII